MKSILKVLLGAAAVYAGYYIVKYLVAAGTWLAAHAVTGVAIGTGGLVAGKWLEDQPWAGSDLLGAMLGTVGWTVLMFSLGSWWGKHIPGKVGKSILSLPPVLKTLPVFGMP